MDDDNDNIVYLNVGGTKMATKRSTLCQVEESLLAAMFSGRWENVDRDEDGHVFLDYNPELFVLVLDYLRAKKIETPDQPASLPPVAWEDAVNFRTLVDYLNLGVDQSVQSDTQTSDRSINDGGKLQFELFSEGIELKNNRTVAKHKVERNCHEFVIGKDEVTANSEAHWRFSLNSVQPDSKLFVGVLDTSCRDNCVSEALTQRRNYFHVPPAYKWEGSYGWVLGENFQTCSNGHVLNTYTFGAIGKLGDFIELHLKTNMSDIPEHTNTELSLFIQPSGVKRCIPLPNSRAWQCVIGSYNAGDCISLIS